MSLFEGMNRKQRREFDKMPTEQKAQVIEVSLMEKISPVMQREITRSMIAGMDLVWKSLYNDYVSKFDDTDDVGEYNEIVGKLMSKIREQYLRIITNEAKDGQDEVPSD